MALELYFPRQVTDMVAGVTIAIVVAGRGNVEFCRGAWTLARAVVTIATGDVGELEARCKAALGADVWGLLEVGLVAGDG